MNFPIPWTKSCSRDGIEIPEQNARLRDEERKHRGATWFIELPGTARESMDAWEDFVLGQRLQYPRRAYHAAQR